MTGISAMPSCRAASTRAWPAIRPPSSPTSAGRRRDDGARAATGRPSATPDAGSRRRVVRVRQPLGPLGQQILQLEIAEPGKRQIKAAELQLAESEPQQLQATVLAHQRRRRPTPFLDARGYCGDLGIRVGAGVFRVRDQPIDRPTLDLVGRPRPLISGLDSRAGARAPRGRGSVGA
jgi:hypothetical protein